MNELNKLIEQYERENPGKRAETWEGPVYYGLERDFVLWMLASRPTCGVEQRLFLDEVEKGRYNSDGVETGLHIGRYTVIWPSDTIADLEKVIKGE